MRPPPATTARAAVVLDALADHIDKVLQAFNDFGVLTKWQPTDESPVEYEIAKLARNFGPGGPWDGADASHAAASAVLFTNQAGMHLEGIADLLRARHVVVPSVRQAIDGDRTRYGCTSMRSTTLPARVHARLRRAGRQASCFGRLGDV